MLKEEISRSFNLNPIIAQLLINRNISEAREIESFLCPHLNHLHDPFLMNGIKDAINRINKAVSINENIMIYGDYDVDGMTSVALLFSALKKKCSNLYYYIPDRTEEGYGISPKGINFAKKYNISLIITVDCGIGNRKEIAELKAINIDTIITDHHEPPEILPDAYAIINPKCCNYPFKELAGVGVTYKLVQALGEFFKEKDKIIEKNLDLVALGTIADSVPLVDENRILVKYGISQLNHSAQPGIQALLKYFNHQKKSDGLSVQEISFNIIPTLNATGRIGDPYTTVDLLLSDSDDRIHFLLEKMMQMNEKRKEMTSRTILEARKMVEEKITKQNPPVMILSSEKWHPGIIGIVASKMMEEFLRPAIVISIQDGLGKGSGRSMEGCNFNILLQECADLLEQFGGHQYAAGITIRESKISLFEQRINHVFCKNEADQVKDPLLNIDSMIALKDINWNFLEELDRLRPFGTGNPEPVFCGYHFPVISSRKVGKEEKHLKIVLGENGSLFDGIGFQMADHYPFLKERYFIDLAFQIGINYWNGKSIIQFIIKDIK